MFHFREIVRNERFLVTIFASGSGGALNNIFSCIRNTDREGYSWRSFKKDKQLVVRLEACLELEDLRDYIEQIRKEAVIVIDGQTKVNFGKLEERAPVFLPYEPRNSVANGWWPGTLKSGFWFHQWFCLNAESTISPATVSFIKKSTGFDLDHLPDVKHNILWIQSLEAYSADITFNSDNGLVTFILDGDVEPCEHLVVVDLWETKETQYSELLELALGQEFSTFKAPFEPFQLGYKLYRKVDGVWKIIAAEKNALMRKLSLNMGIVTGKLEIKRKNKTEIRDIVSYDHPVEVGYDQEKPWVFAENSRNQINEGAELRQMGSVFVRYNGTSTKQDLLKIIVDEIYQGADRFLYVWDPYLDASILPELIVMAISRPRLEVQLLFSELGKSGLESRKNLIEDGLVSYPRSEALFREIQKQDTRRLENLAIRNWYRKDKHAFHDRFILTDKGTWHLGSSIKDIGDYHSTIYRTQGDMSDVIRNEFQNAWVGDFGSVRTYGLELSPHLKWLTSGEEVSK